MRVDPPQAKASEPHISLRDVYVAFGERPVLNGLSCGFPRDRISVILGGSGVGKSTVLRLIGGLLRPSSGAVLVDGDDVTRLSERQLNTTRRKIGMLFQGGALLDSLTVFDNVAFPLREHSGYDRSRISDRVHECLVAVDLADTGELFPNQLSGGMTKRVALARAMVLHPEILLCDEPFSGLDPVSSARIEALLVGLNKNLGLTVVAVSHDVPSTRRMADHLVVLLPDGSCEGNLDEVQGAADARVGSYVSLGVVEV
jgi:phospholipid/cholesterol/gamma-HCH transport system ATP-binding protein